MTVEYSLDQRRYRLDITKKELYEICKMKGVDMKYITMVSILEDQDSARSSKPEQVDMLRQVMSELEENRGITDIYFDER